MQGVPELMVDILNAGQANEFKDMSDQGPTGSRQVSSADPVGT